MSRKDITKGEILEHLFKSDLTIKKGSFLERFLELIDNAYMFYILKKDYKEDFDSYGMNHKINLYLIDTYVISQVVGIFNVFLDADNSVYSLNKVVKKNVKDDLDKELQKIRDYRNNYIAHNNKQLNKIDLKDIKSPVDGNVYKVISMSPEDIFCYLEYGKKVMLNYLGYLLQDNPDFLQKIKYYILKRFFLLEEQRKINI